jgi:hypothetical protein
MLRDRALSFVIRTLPMAIMVSVSIKPFEALRISAAFCSQMDVHSDFASTDMSSIILFARCVFK